MFMTQEVFCQSFRIRYAIPNLSSLLYHSLEPVSHTSAIADCQTFYELLGDIL
jgi:hypothetical protein